MINENSQIKFTINITITKIIIEIATDKKINMKIFEQQNNRNNMSNNYCGDEWHANGRMACPANSVQCDACKKTEQYARVCLCGVQQQ